MTAEWLVPWLVRAAALAQLVGVAFFVLSVWANVSLAREVKRAKERRRHAAHYPRPCAPPEART